MQELAHQLLASIRRLRLMKPGDRVGVAVSGGADSVALLRLLLDLRNELGVVLSVVHFNHHIRGDASDSDEAFVAEVAARQDLELHRSGDDVPSYAAAEHLSLEAAARRLRYRYFESLFRREVLDCVATAHTRDDQAETVLLKMMRGAGTRGLAGIFPVVDIKPGAPDDKHGKIIRPLLPFRRFELESYLQEVGQPWRDDATNMDTKHARNRVRQKLLPLIENDFTPAIRERLGELAEIARAEEEHWGEILRGIFSEARSEENGLSVRKLLAHDLALRRRLVRALAWQAGLGLEFAQVEEVLRLAESPAHGEKQIMLGEEWCAVRTGDRLSFERRTQAAAGAGYEYLLKIPGKVNVPELGSTFEARITTAREVGVCGDQRLSPHLNEPIIIRNWRPGDRFFPAHTKSPKKLKELLQEKRIPHAERHLWPVIQSGDEIAWVRGFPCPAHLLAKDTELKVLVITEQPRSVG